MTKRRSMTIAGLSLAAVITGGSLTAAALPAMAETGSATSAEAATAAPGSRTAETGRAGRGLRGEELTGDVAAQVEAAVLAEYPGATIRRLEADEEGAYEAHIVQADGTRARVKLDEGFAITATGTGAPDRGARGEELTGDVAAQVEAAVLAEYPGATIRRLEADEEGAYEAHIVQADGTRARVKLDESFVITATETGGPGRGARGGSSLKDSTDTDS